MFKLDKIGTSKYILPKTGGMKVPGLVIASKALLQDKELEQTLKQVYNVAHLPGILGYSIAMPDIHWGYGFPIGGVAAMDMERGVISPGGVGYDINCGIRMAMAPIKWNSLKDRDKKLLLDKIFQLVPAGVGKKSKECRLTKDELKNVLKKGARWSIENGFGFKEDLEHTESHGFIEGADPNAVSQHALDRGHSQVGTLGSGNHFVEIGVIDELFLPDIASAWGVRSGETYILIHSGSRGFGHQVCQDTLNEFVKKGFDKGLPDKQLVAAPINSPEGQKYFQAMAAAANFAFNNRQQMLHLVRQAFKEELGVDPQKIPLIYDVAHNIAKFEEHTFNGQMRKVCVHRKGATRAFGPGTKTLAPLFQKTGQPVLVPGDMGTESYLMVGLGNELTWQSACHGAGRVRSRIQSFKHWKGKDPIQSLSNNNVDIRAASYKTIAEEMPDAYKDVAEVVKATQDAGLANAVARLKPSLVLKG